MWLNGALIAKKTACGQTTQVAGSASRFNCLQRYAIELAIRRWFVTIFDKRESARKVLWLSRLASLFIFLFVCFDWDLRNSREKVISAAVKHSRTRTARLLELRKPTELEAGENDLIPMQRFVLHGIHETHPSFHRALHIIQKYRQCINDLAFKSFVSKSKCSP
jgi:hypothetical protein